MGFKKRRKSIVAWMEDVGNENNSRTFWELIIQNIYKIKIYFLNRYRYPYLSSVNMVLVRYYTNT